MHMIGLYLFVGLIVASSNIHGDGGPVMFALRVALWPMGINQ